MPNPRPGREPLSVFVGISGWVPSFMDGPWLNHLQDLEQGDWGLFHLLGLLMTVTSSRLSGTLAETGRVLDPTVPMLSEAKWACNQAIGLLQAQRQRPSP